VTFCLGGRRSSRRIRDIRSRQSTNPAKWMNAHQWPSRSPTTTPALPRPSWAKVQYPHRLAVSGCLPRRRFAGPRLLSLDSFLPTIGWLVLAPIYFKKLLAVMPGLSGLATRYRLTNRRLMICKGFQAAPVQELPLDRIKDVKLVTDANSEFFVAGRLEVLDADGKTTSDLARRAGSGNPSNT